MSAADADTRRFRRDLLERLDGIATALTNCPRVIVVDEDTLAGLAAAVERQDRG